MWNLGEWRFNNFNFALFIKAVFVGVSTNKAGRCNLPHHKCGSKSSTKRKFGWEWKVLFLRFLPAWSPEGRPNIQKRVIWSSMDWALLKFTVAKNSNTKWHERQHFDERSFFGDYLCPSPSIRKHNLGNDKEFKEWPIPISNRIDVDSLWL